MLQVWHLLEHRLVRWLLPDFPLHNTQIAGHYLTVSELKDSHDPEDKECVVVVLDRRELVQESLATSCLWSRRWSFSPGQQSWIIKAVANTTSLIVSHDTFLTVLDFWGQEPNDFVGGALALQEDELTEEQEQDLEQDVEQGVVGLLLLLP